LSLPGALRNLNFNKNASKDPKCASSHVNSIHLVSPQLHSKFMSFLIYQTGATTLLIYIECTCTSKHPGAQVYMLKSIHGMFRSSSRDKCGYIRLHLKLYRERNYMYQRVITFERILLQQFPTFKHKWTVPQPSIMFIITVHGQFFIQ